MLILPLLVACSSAPPVASTSWNGVALDVGGGVVTRNRAEDLAIEYPTLKTEGDAHGAAADLHGQLVRAGWDALYEEPGYHFSRKPSGEGVTVAGLLFGDTVMSLITVLENPGVDESWADVVPDLSHAVGRSDPIGLDVHFFAQPASSAPDVYAQVTTALEARGWTEASSADIGKAPQVRRRVRYELPEGGTALLHVKSGAEQPGVEVKLDIRRPRE